jgi:hypothetical protein
MHFLQAFNKTSAQQRCEGEMDSNINLIFAFAMIYF